MSGFSIAPCGLNPCRCGRGCDIDARISRGLSGKDPNFIRQWNAIREEQETARTRWILGLQSIGIKAAHPEDGHIDRASDDRHDSVKLGNPYFNHGLRLGDLIAIGEPDCYRVRKVLGVKPGSLFSCLIGTPSTKYMVRK